MSIVGAITLLGALAVVATGFHMVRRPHAYLGKGTVPATDPRTVRWFGILFLLLGTFAAALNLIKFVPE